MRVTRRTFLEQTGAGIGLAALQSLLARDASASSILRSGTDPEGPHFAPRAKRVVVLWQGGAPSHVDLFDPKPDFERLRGSEVPESVRNRARLSTMTSGQGRYPVLPAIRPFRRYGECGMELSSLLPHTG
ncbi:MAG: DUF1501 domain-containing protein, partial [Planctomycetes bacterium]|nr:DUF1501 domain-containing protein [Planctomycetota bacterium]